jgi:large subunit ribosomal protein L10
LPTEKKINAVKEFKEWLDGSTIVISTNYNGLSVGDMTILRRVLRAKDVRYRVVKNTLAYRAADEAGQSQIKEIVKGQSAIAFGYGEPTEPAKALSDFIKDSRSSLSITGAVLDGRILSPEQVEQLASLPSKDQLIAQLLGQLQSPITGLANVLNGPLSGLARVLQGQVTKLEQQAS